MKSTTLSLAAALMCGAGLLVGCASDPETRSSERYGKPLCGSDNGARSSAAQVAPVMMAAPVAMAAPEPTPPSTTNPQLVYRWDCVDQSITVIDPSDNTVLGKEITNSPYVDAGVLSRIARQHPRYANHSGGMGFSSRQ
jgi:hypothetical protein